MENNEKNTLIICLEPLSADVELPFGEVTLRELMNTDGVNKFRIGHINISDDISDDMINMIKYNPTGKFIKINDDSEAGFLYEFKFDTLNNRNTLIDFIEEK